LGIFSGHLLRARFARTYAPELQLLHVPLPAWLAADAVLCWLYLPAGQLVHEPPASEYLPAPHTLQPFAADAALDSVPASQAAQLCHSFPLE
jgi:hypothetical protein